MPQQHQRGYLLEITSNSYNFKPQVPHDYHFSTIKIHWMSYYTPSTSSSLLLYINSVKNVNEHLLPNGDTTRFSFCLPIRHLTFSTHHPRAAETFHLPHDANKMNFQFELFYGKESMGDRPLSTVDISPTNPCLIYLTLE